MAALVATTVSSRGRPAPALVVKKPDGRYRLGALRVFRHITLPVLKPIFLILATLSTIWDFKVFTQIWVLLNQRPSREYFLLGIWSYSESFGVTRYGKGAAIAVVMVLLLMALTAFYVRQMLKAVGP